LALRLKKSRGKGRTAVYNISARKRKENGKNEKSEMAFHCAEVNSASNSFSPCLGGGGKVKYWERPGKKEDMIGNIPSKLTEGGLALSSREKKIDRKEWSRLHPLNKHKRDPPNTFAKKEGGEKGPPRRGEEEKGRYRSFRSPALWRRLTSSLWKKR